MKLNPTMTVEEYAKHQSVSKVTVYDWLKRGMRRCSVGKHKSLRIDPVKADVWLSEWRSGKTSKLAEVICRLKFRLKKQSTPLILAAILLILATENIATRPQQSTNNEILTKENTVLTNENRELRTHIALQAETQKHAASLVGYASSVGYDVDKATAELQEQYPNVPQPDLEILTAIEQAKRANEWFDQEIDSLEETWNEYLARCEAMPAGWPLADNAGIIMSGYGWRKRIFRITNLWDDGGVLKEFHHAVDISAPKGTEIITLAPGEVVVAGWEGGYGNVVYIDHGFGYVTVSAHMDEIKVTVGEEVVRGQVIGTVGDTGSTTGDHIHLEVLLNGVPVNPINYLEER